MVVFFSGFQSEVRADLCRLAQFGANITDAYSCFIFLPNSVFCFPPNDNEHPICLDLWGYHSLSQEIVDPCRLLYGVGIVGWVAKHRQPIHVSPFEHDSRTLGMYSGEQHLKSFIGVPVKLPTSSSGDEVAGTLCCDSKKAYAFSKLQVKWLQDLACEVSCLLALRLESEAAEEGDCSWNRFLARGKEVLAALEPGSGGVLRAAPVNYAELEREIGSGGAAELCNQVFRLIKQALPPHLPVCRLPNGDLVMVVDNMMCSFYQNRIAAICARLSRGQTKLCFRFSKRFPADRRSRPELEDLVRATALPPTVHQLGSAYALETQYEYRRA